MQSRIERRSGSTAGRFGSRVDQAAMLVLAMGLDEAPRLLNRLPPSDAQRIGAAVAALRPGMHSGLLAGRVNLVVGEFLESVSADADGADAFLKRLFDGALTCSPERSALGGLMGRSRARLRSLAAAVRRGVGAGGCA